jgi:ribosome-associated protein
MEQLQGLLKEIEDLKFGNIKVYESKGKSIFADHFIVATAESTVQMEAARSNLMDYMKKHGIRLKNPMEDWHGGWCLLDFGNIIVHFFMEESRRFYDLDSLFESYNFDPKDIVESPMKKEAKKKAKKAAKKAAKSKAKKTAAKKTARKAAAKPAKKTTKPSGKKVKAKGPAKKKTVVKRKKSSK